ncbi:hypothetical protein F511_28332 [Dorcoceras hygrometricum]|uniref:Uncharacterized protein n=1 Tax=Dorcoceras hygrometricum TaxID=472368 RepID=A0A2Z7B1P3_9LAMI|nr:hypothetical protein F511_28332 [Dorcoceras hygrometricum]
MMSSYIEEHVHITDDDSLPTLGCLYLYVETLPIDDDMTRGDDPQSFIPFIMQGFRTMVVDDERGPFTYHGDRHRSPILSGSNMKHAWGEIEVRELPAQPPSYTGTTRSSLNIASWYSQFNRIGIARKIGLTAICVYANATADIVTQAQVITAQSIHNKQTYNSCSILSCKQAHIRTSSLLSYNYNKEDCHNDADPPPAQRQHNNCSKTEAHKSNSRELQLNQRYPTSSNTTESSNKLKGRN